ncbi:DUF1947 domain-containing protein [Sulfodiicoccus acidiphilus]|uniref:DUF1947 domain-containing protein n=1 Tax=Sulfodiicoccus acidiphilus TaxID=1670455 RepID=UPI0013158ECC|nr:DUF1947 domain-containing protein [Sulfodiicoccus acidiphilus]
MSEKEREELESRLFEKYGFQGVIKAEIVKGKRTTFYIVNEILAFVGEELVPTICAVNKLGVRLPKVLVDDGAVMALSKGADLFVPGIRGTEGELRVGGLVVATTLKGIPVAILKVKTILGQEVTKGKFGENIHHVGDELWEACSKSKLPKEK